MPEAVVDPPVRSQMPDAVDLHRHAPPAPPDVEVRPSARMGDHDLAVGLGQPAAAAQRGEVELVRATGRRPGSRRATARSSDRRLSRRTRSSDSRRPRPPWSAAAGRRRRGAAMPPDRSAPRAPPGRRRRPAAIAGCRPSTTSSSRQRRVSWSRTPAGGGTGSDDFGAATWTNPSSRDALEAGGLQRGDPGERGSRGAAAGAPRCALEHRQPPVDAVRRARAARRRGVRRPTGAIAPRRARPASAPVVMPSARSLRLVVRSPAWRAARPATTARRCARAARSGDMRADVPDARVRRRGPATADLWTAARVPWAAHADPRNVRADVAQGPASDRTSAELERRNVRVDGGQGATICSDVAGERREAPVAQWA